MKLLPRKHAETSREWFGKKGNFTTYIQIYIYINYKTGISMHAMHILRNNSGSYESFTMFHSIYGSDTQDSRSVIAILSHGLKALKGMTTTSQNPTGINKVYIRTDQAGCYKCSHLISVLPALSQHTGIWIAMYTFSEAQVNFLVKFSSNEKILNLKRFLKI